MPARAHRVKGCLEARLETSCGMDIGVIKDAARLVRARARWAAGAGPVADIQGTVAAGFEPVLRTFEENFQRRGEWGASVNVWRDGQQVVDLWGGELDRSTLARWRPDTLTTVFSCTKGMVALCFLLLAEEGRLDYDAPVAKYWPKFGQAGKQDITVRTLLNHRAGLVGLHQAITLDMLESPESLAQHLEQQSPVWEPGAAQGYHAITYGLYTQALFQRITGRSLQSFFQARVAAPLGADVYMGLPQELEPRVATNYPATLLEGLTKIAPKALMDSGHDGRVYRQVMLGKDAALAFNNPKELGPSGIHNFNTRRVHRLGLAWGGAIASARGLARIYASMIDAERPLVSEAALKPLQERQSWSELDRVLRKPVGWSQGFLKEELRMFSPNRESFGHAGAGGSLGWCDPKERLAIGYVTNKMDHRVRSVRARALCASIYACL